MSADSQDLAVVATVPSELEAGAIVGLLEQHGIRAVATGSYTAGFRAEAPGQVRVLVTRQNLGRARDVLDQAHDPQGDIDWADVDVGHPEE